MSGAEVDVVERGGQQGTLTQDVDDLSVELGDGGEVRVTDNDVLREQPLLRLSEEHVLREQTGISERSVPHGRGRVTRFGAGRVGEGVATAVGRSDEGRPGDAVGVAQQVLALGELVDDLPL